MQLVFKNILRFILLVLLQVFVLDNIQFLGYIIPLLYVLVILSLPIRMPQWAQLLVAFALGLTIDMFSNTPGMHTFATVFVAFFRNFIIGLFVSVDDILRPTPTFSNFGVAAYVKYVVLTVLLHHAVLFIVEAFTFTNITLLLPKILLSSVVTILIILAAKSIFSFGK